MERKTSDRKTKSKKNQREIWNDDIRDEPKDENAYVSNSKDDAKVAVDNGEENGEEEMEEEDEEQDDEDVLELVMAEKNNAMHRGKSVEFDRTFVPRLRQTADLEEQSSPSSGHVSNTTEDAGNLLKRASSSPLSSIPGAYHVATPHNSHESESGPSRSIAHGSDASFIVIPSASLVGDEDPETPASSDNDKLPPFVSAVEKVEESHKPDNPNCLNRWSRCRYLSVVLLLLLIVVILISILVKLPFQDSSPEQLDVSKPPPGEGDMWKNGKGYRNGGGD
jgi:hypothetical protein